LRLFSPTFPHVKRSILSFLLARASGFLSLISLLVHLTPPFAPLTRKHVGSVTSYSRPPPSFPHAPLGLAKPGSSFVVASGNHVLDTRLMAPSASRSAVFFRFPLRFFVQLEFFQLHFGITVSFLLFETLPFSLSLFSPSSSVATLPGDGSLASLNTRISLCPPFLTCGAGNFAEKCPNRFRRLPGFFSPIASVLSPPFPRLEESVLRCSRTAYFFPASFSLVDAADSQVSSPVSSRSSPPFPFKPFFLENDDFPFSFPDFVAFHFPGEFFPLSRCVRRCRPSWPWPSFNGLDLGHFELDGWLVPPPGCMASHWTLRPASTMAPRDS